MIGRRSAALAVAAVAAAFAAPRPAFSDDSTLPYQVRDRAHAAQLIAEFGHSTAAGNFDRAADRLQQILDLPADDPVVVRVEGRRPPLFEGVSLVARRLFDGLSPEGRAAWERVSRGHAEELLARGLRLRREADFREAARRFPAQDVRRRAHDALAHLALARGDAQTASFQLRALLDAAEPADRPEVLARLALVASQTGDADEVARVAKLAEPSKDAPVPGPAGPEALAAFLERAARAARGAATAPSRQFGGDVTGSGVSDAPPQPESPQWTVATEFQEGNLNDDDGYRPTSKESQRPVWPVIRQGLTFLDNGLSVRAVDIAGGAVLWRKAGPQPIADWRDHAATVHAVAVADGVVFAPLAVGTTQTGTSFNRVFMDHVILNSMPRRALYALDARTGDVLWSHEPARLGGRDDAEVLGRESIASPPLVAGDDVYVATWTYEGIYEVALVCFDRRDGRTRWRTTLAQGQQEMNLFGRPIKELVASPLAVSSSRIVLATGLGVAAAVEREDGRVAWLAGYSQTQIPPAFHWWETRDREVTWLPSPATAVDGLVILAPPDSAELSAYDAATGARRWTRSFREGRATYRWYLGATGGRAFVLGNRLTAIDVATGANAWTLPGAGDLQAERLGAEEAEGCAVLSADRVFVPLDRAILVFDAATGAAQATWPLVGRARGVAPSSGNLVSGDGALLVVSRAVVDACYRFEDQRQRIEARIAADPEDLQARLDAGEVYAASGHLDEAVDALHCAFPLLARLPASSLDRTEAALRRALYRALAARAEEHRGAGEHDAACADLREAAAVARDKGDVVHALFELSDALEAASRADEAEAPLARIQAEFGEIVTVTRDGDRAVSGSLAALRRGDVALRAGRKEIAVKRWLDLLEAGGADDLGASSAATAVRRRLETLSRTEPELVKRSVHERAERAFDAARASGEAAAMDRVARLYPDPEIAADAALEAADTHLAAGRGSEAVGVLSALLASPQPPPVAARALWTKARAFRVLGDPSRERTTLRQLSRDFAAVRLLGSTAGALAERELADPRLRGGPDALPDVARDAQLLWHSSSDPIPQILRLAGAEVPELAGKLVLAQAGVVEAVDAATGASCWKRPLLLDVRAAACLPGRIVLTGEDPRAGGVIVVGLSPADGRVLWRTTLPGRYRAAETNLGYVYVLRNMAQPGADRPSFGVAAVSMGDGEVRCDRVFANGLSPRLRVAEDALVVTEPSRGRDVSRRTLIVLDGETLATRGRADLAGVSSGIVAHPALSDVVVTSDGPVDLAAFDLANCAPAWRFRIPGDDVGVRAVLAIPGALIVSDKSDTLRRIDAATGRQTWAAPLASVGSLDFEGEAAEGSLVVATLKRRVGDGSAVTAVGLDAATGDERWRTPLP